jgi:hypothetical protein
MKNFSVSGVPFNTSTLSRDDAMQVQKIERVSELSAEQFQRNYVDKNRAVVVAGALKNCTALTRWNFDFLRQVSGNQLIYLKQGLSESGLAGITKVACRLQDYLQQLQQYESALAAGKVTAKDKPAYLHDIPLTSVLPDAIKDLEDFPQDYFPAWYGQDWWRFAQFFLGPTHSLTPLHFDCLLTHNLFFQVTGRKCFTLLPYQQRQFCYVHQWRWCQVNVEQPDFDLFPLYRNAQAQTVVVEAGDMLYMPPGMLHHVRSLECSISFNVDWHTRTSALAGVAAITQGMPLANVYYNSVIALGQLARLAPQTILPLYRSYLKCELRAK